MAHPVTLPSLSDCVSQKLIRQQESADVGIVGRLLARVFGTHADAKPDADKAADIARLHYRYENGALCR